MEEFFIVPNSENVIHEEVVSSEPADTEWAPQYPAGVELTDTKCFKTPSGVQKTATIMREHLGMINDEDNDESERESKPLERMQLQIGKKLLKFKVMNASDAPQSTEVVDQGWLNRIEPLQMPKSLRGLYHCEACKTYFGNVEVFKDHMLNAHGDPRPYRCFHCGMNFASKTTMNRHYKSHSKLSAVHECEVCHKKFAKLDRYILHMKLHSQSYHCTRCIQFFRSKDLLMRHMHDIHQPKISFEPERGMLKNGKSARFECGFCGYLCHFKRDLLVHERTHTGEKPYTCGYCHRSFAQSQALTIHVRTHTKETPYSCEICYKRFKDNTSLRRHELHSHTKMDPSSVIYKITRNVPIKEKSA